MNSLWQHGNITYGYISKLLTLKDDAQYSEATQTRLQERKIIIQTQK